MQFTKQHEPTNKYCLASVDRRWERILMITFKDICIRRLWFFSCGHREDVLSSANRHRGPDFLSCCICHLTPDPYKVLAPSARNYGVISGNARWRSNLLSSIVLTDLLHAAERFLRSWQFLWYRRTYAHSLEPESSLPCSKHSTSSRYPELDESNRRCPVPFLTARTHCRCVAWRLAV